MSAALAANWPRPAYPTVDALTQATADSALTEIVRSQLNRNFVTRYDANEVFPHLSSDVRYDSMSILELDTKLSTRKGLDNRPRKLNHFFIAGHRYNKV